MAGPSITQKAGALVAGGAYSEALRLLVDGERAGEVEALVELALWRINGSIIRRDLAGARDLLARAGAGGHLDAALLHSYFLAAGVGGEADWTGALAELRRLAAGRPIAAEQLRLLAAMDLDENGFPTVAPQLRLINEAPEVSTSVGFASAAECDYLVTRAAPAFAPSTVVDPQSGQMVPHPVRRSQYSVFGVFQEDLVVGALNRRIAALSKTSLVQGETMQVLRYGPGDEYRPHFDTLPPPETQRIATVLISLNQGYGGGETHFPRADVSFKGAKGDALLFRNVGPDGRPDPHTLHAGLPVTSGVKLIASRWIRAAPFHFPPPQPILPA